MAALMAPRRVGAAAALITLATAGAASAAGDQAGFAGSSVVGPTLVVALSEQGLGANKAVRYRLLADLSATFGCTLNGRTIPGRTLRVPGLSATAALRTGADGSLLDHLTLDPRDQLQGYGRDGLGCRSGWQPGVREIRYTNVRLEDLTDGTTLAPVPADVRTTRDARAPKAPPRGS